MTNAAMMHTREHAHWLAASEQRALMWMAHRMPPGINSDHLTVLGLVSTLAGGVAYWMARSNEFALLLVVPALALNWLGDSLDGTLARVRNQQRPRYGYYVDHVIDIVGAFFLLGGLALSGYMTPAIAMGLLILYLMVSAEIYLATHARGVFKPSFLGFGPTELRIVLALGTVWLLYRPRVELLGVKSNLFDVGGLVAIVGLAFALVVTIVRNTRALYRTEPLPKVDPRSRIDA